MASSEMTRSGILRWDLVGLGPVVLACVVCAVQAPLFGRVRPQGMSNIRNAVRIKGAFCDIRARAERAVREKTGIDVRRTKCAITVTSGQGNRPDAYKVEFSIPDPPGVIILDNGVQVVLSGRDLRVLSVSGP